MLFLQQSCLLPISSPGFEGLDELLGLWHVTRAPRSVLSGVSISARLRVL